MRALRSAEENEIGDDSTDRDFADRLIVAVTYEGDRPAFASVDELGAMRSDDFDELWRAVFGTTKKPGVFDVVSPSYIRSDSRAWGERLRAGARHGSNAFETLLLAQAYDWAGGAEQPDRYFGVPLIDLTDGQLMAYRAAHEVIATTRRKRS